jgi:D-alanyl-D-alanine carboxypeptidase (penicillin-binding protein 5/6)
MGGVLRIVALIAVVAARGEGAGTPAAPRAMVLADVTSGRVLREHGADDPLASGTLGYLMIALLVAERVEAGQLTWEQRVDISERAASASGAQLALQVGEQLTLEAVTQALLVTGAPDAAMALAETLAGDTMAAGAVMNERARSLGMHATEFGSLSGSAGATATPTDVTSARDTARLAVELAQHPRVFSWAALDGTPFRSGALLLRNRNQLLSGFPGANGLWACESARSGMHVVASTQRGRLHLIAVTLGASDNATRYGATAEWLEWGFATFERIDIVRTGEPLPIPIRVKGGLEQQFVPVAGAGCSVLRRRNEERRFEISFQLPDVLPAPIARDQRVGEIIVRENEQLLSVVAAISATDLPAADGVLSSTVP